MRIGIDARLYGPRVGGGGLGRYVEELVKHLEQLDDQNEYVIFLRKENWNDYAPTNPRFEKKLAPWRWYTLAEQIGMPRVIREAHIDLLHVPHFNIPLFSRIPLVVTIHDLILFSFTSDVRVSTLGPIQFWIKYLGFKFVLSQAVRRACRIITVSAASYNTLRQHFALSPSQVTIIYSGFTPPLANEKTAKISTDFQPYLLSVGNAYPHKNLDSLLDAFYAILKEIPQAKLVMIGPNDTFREQLRAQAQKLGISDRIFFTGFVDDEALDGWYRGATAYVVPSLLEGFAMPGLEAQSRGIPVLASNIDVHQEVFAESALYFDPKNTETLSTAIKKIFTDDSLRRALSRKGLENYRRYSWPDAARLTLEIYRQCHAKTNSKKENNSTEKS